MAEAENCSEKQFATQFRVLATDSQDLLRAQSNLGGILIFEGRYAEAARKTLDIQVRAFGLLSPDSIDTRRQVAMAMAHNLRYAEAVDLIREAVAQQDQPEAYGNRWAAQYALACVAAAGDRVDDALEYLRAAVDRGFNDVDFLTGDGDLKSLRHNPQFLELVAQLRHHGATVPAH